MKVGSAVLTVTAPSVPPPSGSQEPSGFVKINERAFNALSTGSGTGVEGWNGGEERYSDFSITSDATAPRSASAVAQVRYPAGWTGGSAPVVTRLGLQGQRELYVSVWIKLSSNWVGHSSGVNKYFFVWIAGEPRFYFSAQGSGSNWLEPQMRLQGVPGGAANYGPNLAPSAQVRRGQWHHFEFVLVANTPGQSNGQMHLWMDGVKVSAYTQLAFVTASESNGWREFDWTPVWGGMSGTIAVEQTMRWDHFYISGR